MRAMRKLLIALFAGTIIGLVPMFAEQAEAQRFGGRGGGVGVGGGRVGIGGGRVGIARVGWGGRSWAWGGRPGLARAAWWGGRPGLRRAAWWGGYPGWRFRRAAWWGAPLAVGAFAAYGYGSSCYQWDPYFGWVNACYSSYGWNRGYW